MLWNSIMDVAHFLYLHVPISVGYTFVHTLVFFSPGLSDLLPKLLKMWKADTKKPFSLTAYAVGPEFVRGVLAFDRFLLLKAGERGSAASDCPSWKQGQECVSLLLIPGPVLTAQCMKFIVGVPADAMAGWVTICRRQEENWFNTT